jgi:hypothetical protein
MSNDETGAIALLAGIQKLKGVVNYQDWKFQVQNYLEHRSLWSAVKPTTPFMTLIHHKKVFFYSILPVRGTCIALLGVTLCLSLRYFFLLILHVPFDVRSPFNFFTFNW